MTTDARTMDAGDWGLLLLLSLLWGGAFFFVGVAVRDLPPLTIVLARVGLAALTLLPLFWLSGHRLPRGLADWLPFLGMGLLNNALPFSFIVAGQTEIGAGLAAIVNSMTPLFTVLIMAVFRAERLTVLRGLGVVLGIVGVAILRGIDAPLGGAQTIGIALCMAGAASYGCAALWARRRLAGIPPITSATCQLICSTAMMALVVAAIDRPWTLPLPSAEAVAALVGLAVLGTALAYLVFFKLLVRAGASNAMLVTLLIPVSAIALGAAFLDEPVTWRKTAGALVIGLGLVFIDGRGVAWARARLVPIRHRAPR